MEKMRAMVIEKAGGPLVAQERDLPLPGPQEMRIRVEACGVCHSDSLTVEGRMPGIQYPRVPGHEAIGVVDALGPASAGSAAPAATAAVVGATALSPAKTCTK